MSVMNSLGTEDVIKHAPVL